MSLELSYPEIAESLYQALQVDAFYQTLEGSIVGSPEHKHQGMLAYYDFSMLEAKQYGILCITDDKLSGASLWSKPLSSKLNNLISGHKKAFIKDNLGIDSLTVYQTIVTNMTELTTPVVSAKDWYLSILGIHPDRQNSGLGQTLLNDVLIQADTAGVDTYLETFTPKNMSFYERLGYETILNCDEPVTGTGYAVMKRQAQ